MLVLGLTGELYSHILTCALTVLVLLAIYLSTIYFQKDKFKILKALITSTFTFILTSAGFLYPMLRFYSNSYRISTPQKRNFLYYANGVSDLVNSALNNQVDMNHANVGIWLLLILFFGAFLFKSSSNLEKLTYVFGVVLAFLGTDLFPWQLFHNTFIENIQFPRRFYSIAIVFLAYYLAAVLTRSF